MSATLGYAAFLAAPLVLGGWLLRADPRCRRIRIKSIGFYLLVMGLLIGGAMYLVASIAQAEVAPFEVAIALWFTVAARLTWAVWTRTVGRWGQRWVRWGRLRRLRGLGVPPGVRFIPPCRALLTALVFFPAFFAMVATHRCKFRDGGDPRGIFSRDYEPIAIPTVDGLLLDGWFIPQPHAARTIIVCHGAGANKGNFIWFLPALDHPAYNVLMFDFRAHGGSQGHVATYGIRERGDVRAAVDWLKLHHPEEARQIVGLGSSQGAFALALAAAEDERIDAVVMDSPFISPRALLRDQWGRVGLLGRALADYMLTWASLMSATDFVRPSAERAVRALGPRPLLVIHGDEDFVMPTAHAQALFAAASGPKELWLGRGPHSNIVTTDPSEYRRQVFDFLEKYLPTP